MREECRAFVEHVKNGGTPPTDGREESDWRFGMYQGPLAVQGLHFDVRKFANEPRRMGYIDHPAHLELDGQMGYGVLGYKIAGPNRRFGFKSFDDVAL